MKKAISILKFFLIIAIIGGIGFLFVKGSTTNLANIDTIKVEIGDYGKAPTSSDFKDYSDRYLDKMNIALKSGATVDQKLEAVYAIYRTTCLAMAEAPYYATRGLGSGSAGGSGGDLEIAGGMTIFTRNFKMKTADSTGKNKYSNYGFFETYSMLSEITGISSDTARETITSAASGALGYGKSEATTAAGKTYRRISAANVESFDEGMKIKEGKKWKAADPAYKSRETLDKEYAEDEFARKYGDDWHDKYGEDSPELTNHVINKGTIDKKMPLSLEKKTIGGKTVYVVKFSIDCNNPEATKYSAASIQGTASMIKDLKYTKLDIEMEVFESGYMRNWKTAEDWAAGLNLVLAVIQGASKATNDEYYCYDKKEVESGITDNWFGQDAWKK